MAEVKDKLVTVEAAKIICENLAAPAGYGLGGNVSEESWYGINGLIKSGWYSISDLSDIDGVSIERAILRVDGNNSSYYGSDSYFEGSTSSLIIQTLWAFDDDTGTIYKLHRHYTPSWHGTTGDSAWHEWEWENPPMFYNMEFRTTERYMGVPVKTQLVSCGTVTKGNTLTYAHGINISTLVRAEIIVGRQSLPFLYDGDLTSQYSITGYVNKDNVFVKNGSGNGQYEVYARIWYI